MTIWTHHFIYRLGDVSLGSIKWSFTGHFGLWSGLRVFFPPASNIWDGRRIWTLIDSIRLRFWDLARNFGYFDWRDDFDDRSPVGIRVSVFGRRRVDQRRLGPVRLFGRFNRRLGATVFVGRALAPTPLLLNKCYQGNTFNLSYGYSKKIRDLGSQKKSNAKATSDWCYSQKWRAALIGQFSFLRIAPIRGGFGMGFFWDPKSRNFLAINVTQISSCFFWQNYPVLADQS